ncbi:restriction endonuclease subunit S [Proteiniphilum propionicum]|uniref:restriction endonuclease subunit S n=1 Tax=Proteiniphilum propionicum TaxID=2829812 RepID=UPI001EEAB9F6|nr:restriction endonuclease subunit S [Proteiniphilum propionicum]ULB35157.1 restriction endonuclease subunit S [Proteiniphilum propionicum]
MGDIMEEKKNIPEIRFEGFVGEWEESFLDRVADVRDGTHASPKYLLQGHPFITSKNLKNGDISYEDINYISDIDFNEINKRSKVDINDILMGMIGTIGNIALIKKSPDFAIKNVALIKDTGKVYYLYLYYYFHINFLTKQLINGMDGGTQKFIALNKIRKLSVLLPSKTEQSQIGTFFQNLDKQITLEQQKHDKLVTLKKAMLEKMFPKEGASVPEIRFDGFEGEWIAIILKEISNITIGEFVIRTKQNPNSLYPVYNGGKSYTGFYDEYNNEGDKVLISARGANAGFVNIVTSRYWAGNSCYSVDLIDKNLFNTDFIYQFMKNNQNRLIDNQQAANIPSVSKSEVEKFVILSPIFEEQNQIATYFQNLDKLISLQQQKIDKLKNIKKACLDKMFV